MAKKQTEERPAEAVAEQAPVAADTVPRSVRLQRMLTGTPLEDRTVTELKEIAELAGADASGSKTELVEAVREATRATVTRRKQPLVAEGDAVPHDTRTEVNNA